MTFDSMILFGKRLLDVLLVWLVFYYILKSLRKNVKMILLFKGILFIVVLKIVSDLLDLVTIGYLLDYVIMWGPLALIIIFQPEIRNVLEQLGRSQLLGRHKVLTVDEREKMVYEIIQAVDYLGQKVGDPKTLEYSITNGDVTAPEITLEDNFIQSTYNLGDTLRINMAGMTVTDNITKDEALLKSTIKIDLENTDTDETWRDLDNEGNAEAGEYIFTHPLESAGDYTMTITITDEAGNKATRTVSFTVSTESSDPVNVTEVLGGILIAVSVVALAGVVIYFIVSKVKLDKREKKYKQDIDDKK